MSGSIIGSIIGNDEVLHIRVHFEDVIAVCSFGLFINLSVEDRDKVVVRRRSLYTRFAPCTLIDKVPMG